MVNSHLRVNLRAVLHKVGSSAPADSAFGLLLRKNLLTRFPAARIFDFKLWYRFQLLCL